MPSVGVNVRGLWRVGSSPPSPKKNVLPEKKKKKRFQSFGWNEARFGFPADSRSCSEDCSRFGFRIYVCICIFVYTQVVSAIPRVAPRMPWHSESHSESRSEDGLFIPRLGPRAFLLGGGREGFPSFRLNDPNSWDLESWSGLSAYLRSFWLMLR